MSTIEKALAKLRHRSKNDKVPADAVPNAVPLAVSTNSRSQHSHLQQFPIDESANKPDLTDSSDSFSIRLPFHEMRKQGFLTPDASRSRMAEEYREIKRPLLINIDKRGADIVENANLIMVTSSLPGEGKTFNSINLAISIAMEKDRTVLLVDGDVAKPSVAERLNLNVTNGLTDVLAGEKGLSIADVLLKTNIPNLRFLPAGHQHEHATELLASEYMSIVMDEFASRYRDRVVIFDSPPLLLTSESAVLGSMMGQIVLVVAAEQTLQHTVFEALTKLDNEKIIGLILNKYRPGLGNRQGTGYGYYGKYGSYYSHSEENEAIQPS
jgi:exopolysaccharide/PEP-CTERM locus tyrosine autokinase